MVIKNISIECIKKRLTVTVKYKGESIDFTVWTYNGLVEGDHTKIATATLKYFHEVPEHIRRQHFAAIKKAIEKRTVKSI